MGNIRVYMYLSLLLMMGIFVQKTTSFVLDEKRAPVYVFGDSLYDGGLNNYINTTTDYQSNFSPYGETFYKYPNGRFNDGRIIPDFIGEYAKLPFILPYMHPDAEDYYMYGVNFASGGSGALLETAQGYVKHLATQVSYYKNVRNVLRKKVGDSATKELLSKAVYLLSVGSNDYGARFVTNNSALLRYSEKQMVDIVIGNTTNAIKEIYKMGGRKFSFINVGRIGCSPIIRALVEGDKCNEELSAVARLHNRELPKMLLKVQKQLNGFTYSIFDFYTSTSQIFDYPSKYGFKVSETACCGGGAYRGDDSCGGKRGITKYELCDNPNDYLFFDSAHPTDKANHYFSNLMWNANRTYNYPINLRQLFQL